MNLALIQAVENFVNVNLEDENHLNLVESNLL